MCANNNIDSTETKCKGTLLIVDDNSDNLRVLNDMLTTVGYKVRVAISGELALDSIRLIQPNLLLLDIRMPGIDGYEVCRRLKEDKKTRDIPVIFISALQDIEDKISAFKVGGVDYVSKPFQPEEVLARVSTHIALYNTREQLKLAYAQVERRVQERTMELQESYRYIQCQSKVEKTLGDILRLSLTITELESYLESVLEVLAENTPWYDSRQKNGVFLTKPLGTGRTFRLAASRNFSREHAHSCSSIDFNHYICSQVVERKEIIYCNGISNIDKRFFNDMVLLGYYSVPILESDKLMGVLVHFIDHEDTEEEKVFLQRVADILSTGINHRSAEEKIKHMAYHDTLTGLPNRRLLIDRINQELMQERRRGTCGALLFVDLDGFKKVNDVFGHNIGDKILQKMANRICVELRKEDTVVRWGGDEFIIMLPVMSKKREVTVQKAYGVAEKLRQVMSQPFQIECREIQVTASIGIVLFPSDNENGEVLVNHSDTAMYQAKQKGRNRICFYQSELENAVEERRSLEKDLRQALFNNELTLFFQPQFDGNGRVVGAEALLRWHHPIRGQVCPADFIPIAEETGIILPIGHWVLCEACRHVRQWADEGLLNNGFRRLSFNASAKQFYEPNFIEQITAALEETGTDPCLLEVEVTESILMVDLQETIDTLKQLRQLGLALAIDDFGTGYSSLAYLSRLPVDKLKIDRSFVSDVHKYHHGAAIVGTIIALAKHLDLQTVAEGVETDEEFAFLRSKACEMYQGFFFEKPLPSDNFKKYLSVQ